MIIYKTTNLINGKIYIGQDKNNNEKYIGSGDLIKRAIKKYGKENFIKEIICYCDNQEDLDNNERFYIKKYNSIDENIGYNISVGGRDGTMLNRKMSEETRKKISNSHKGKKLTKNHKAALSNSHTGKKVSEETRKKMSESQKLINRAKPMSEEIKKKISESKKGKKVSEETRKKMSKAHKGIKNHFYGKSHTNETIIKISKSKTGVSSPKKGKKYV